MPGSRRGRRRDPLDAARGAQGLHRTVVASVPTIAAALDVVRDSDSLVVIAGPRTTPAGVVTRDLPLQLPPAPMNLSWHQRYDTDPAHRWLRAQVRGALVAAAPPQH